ncbi:DUF998 domain-containing protein [Nocardia sp. NPDC052001]|uniref:DUF998 domain-containing protein n=1 Tax=unclassified Nocardia TaxID=2637762 RepID=UPI00344488D9
MTRTQEKQVAAAPSDAPPTPRWRRVLRWCIAILIGLAGLGYSSWVLEFLLPIPSDPTNTFLSQLAEKGAPFRWVFTTGDTVSGTMLAVAGIGGLLLFSRRRYSTIGWIALTCFGLSTIADAQWPIDPTVTHTYSESGLVPQLHQIHALTSSLAVFSIYIAMIAFSVAAFKYKRWPILRHTGLWILIIGSVVTAWMLIADNLPGNYGLGIAQRIQVGAMSLWLVVLAVQIVLAERDSDRRAG